MKRIWVLTLFPQFFDPFKDVGVVGQVLDGKRGIDLRLETVYLGDFSERKFKGVDDSPYGGGPGMIMRADVLKEALVKGVVEKGGYGSLNDLHVIYTSPRGETWKQEDAKQMQRSFFISSEQKDLVFICGRYEGIDERFLKAYVQQTISLGDFVLSGGELAVMTILDSIIRLLPGSLGNQLSFQEESFEHELLEHPQYTKPRLFDGQEVPDVLLSGDHKKIQEYNLREQIRVTKKYRPEMYERFLGERN